MLLTCWSMKGGVGTSLVVAGVAAAAMAAPDGAPLGVAVVDLCGDLPALYGIGPVESAGIAGWLRAGPQVPAGALRRLEVMTLGGIALVPRGVGEFAIERAPALADLLVADERTVVVDLGTHVGHPVGEALLEAADRTVLVTRACPLAQHRLAHVQRVPDGVVVVRDHRRSLRWPEISEAAGAPVLAELDVDPAVGAAVDAGLDRHPLPRRFVAALAGVV